VKLKISDVNNNGGQLTINNVNHPNPGLFFTAALSGCSVIVVGDPRNPSVYHGGSGNPVGGELQGHEKTEAFWLRKAGRHGEIANKPLGSIGKTDYISELIGGARTDADRMDKQTTLSIQLKQNLVASGALAEVSLLPWGYVFGLRKDDGTWVFYLVKCVSLSYYKWRVKKRMFGRDKRVHEGEMRLSGLSPTTGGNLAIDPSTGGVAYKTVRIAAQGVGQTVYDPIGAGDYSEQQISDCKVIGYEKFFPGRGKVHVRNIPMTQLY